MFARRELYTGRLEAPRIEIARFLDRLDLDLFCWTFELDGHALPLPSIEYHSDYGAPYHPGEEESPLPGEMLLYVFWDRDGDSDYWIKWGATFTDSPFGRSEFYGGHVALAPGLRQDDSDTSVTIVKDSVLLWEHWEYVILALRAHFTELGKGGRPKGSGLFTGRDDFLRAICQAKDSIEKHGHKITQERVASYFNGSSTMPTCDARQLRRWCKQYGFASWRALGDFLS